MENLRLSTQYTTAASRPKFAVLRKRWLNGSNVKPTHKMYLYHPKKRHMDILGFYLNSMGVMKKTLYCNSFLRSSLLEKARDPAASWLFEVVTTSEIKKDRGDFSSLAADAITHVNDDRTLNNEQREFILSALFRAQGVEVEFI